MERGGAQRVPPRVVRRGAPVDESNWRVHPGVPSVATSRPLPAVATRELIRVLRAPTVAGNDDQNAAQAIEDRAPVLAPIGTRQGREPWRQSESRVSRRQARRPSQVRKRSARPEGGRSSHRRADPVSGWLARRDPGGGSPHYPRGGPGHRGGVQMDQAQQPVGGARLVPRRDRLHGRDLQTGGQADLRPGCLLGRTLGGSSTPASRGTRVAPSTSARERCSMPRRSRP